LFSLSGAAWQVVLLGDKLTKLRASLKENSDRQGFSGCMPR
jgi:hypothetical protein